MFFSLQVDLIPRGQPLVLTRLVLLVLTLDKQGLVMYALRPS